MERGGTDWRHNRVADTSVRAGGFAMLGLAGISVHALTALRAGLSQGAPPPWVFGLAMIGFIGASFGSALVVLGRHIFDRVEISERWARRSPILPRDAGSVEVGIMPMAVRPSIAVSLMEAGSLATGSFHHAVRPADKALTPGPALVKL
jgi:xanthosine utilization system XapX-like protein